MQCLHLHHHLISAGAASKRHIGASGSRSTASLLLILLPPGISKHTEAFRSLFNLDQKQSRLWILNCILYASIASCMHCILYTSCMYATISAQWLGQFAKSWQPLLAFWMCSTKILTSVTSFYSIKKLSIWGHAASKFTNFGCLVCQPDLRVFACMEFGRTITLVADHITTSQSGCLLNKCGNNQSVSSWHAVWAAWNRSQRSVPSLIFFSQHSLGPCLGLAVVWQQLHWKWLKLFLKWRNCRWRCWAQLAKL